MPRRSYLYHMHSYNFTAGRVTRWELPGVSQCLIVHDGSAGPNCAPFTLAMISDDSGTTVSSTVEITVTDRALDGEIIECRAGVSATDLLVRSVNISVLSKFNLLLAK